ncbi:MAG: hypothetical protein LPK02_07135 [Rhodobacterales bacterium]|nr:hypothetical protein [Rhodobacterales bacterium]
MITEHWIKTHAYEIARFVKAHRNGDTFSIHRTNGHWNIVGETLLDEGVAVDLTPDDPDFMKLRIADGVIVEVVEDAKMPTINKPRITITGNRRPETSSLPAYAGSW